MSILPPTRILTLVFVLGLGLGACNRAQPTAPTPVPQPQPLVPVLHVFTDPATGFSTSDLRDADGDIIQFNSASELIWPADNTHVPGYTLDRHPYPEGVISWISGQICAEGCAFEIRFGTRDGQRGAYLTADYGHWNPGTLLDLEVVNGAVSVTQTSAFPPGTPTLSGVVTEATAAGRAPVEGAKVYRSIVSGWRDTITDKNGYFEIQGLVDGNGTIGVSRGGQQIGEIRDVPIRGDTRFDIEIKP